MDNLLEEDYKIFYREYYRFTLLLNKLSGKLPFEALEYILDSYKNLDSLITNMRLSIDVSHLEKAIQEEENGFLTNTELQFAKNKKELLYLLRKTRKYNLIEWANPSNKNSFINEIKFCIRSLYNTYIISNIEPLLSDEEFGETQVEALKDAISYLNSQMARAILEIYTAKDPMIVAEASYEYKVYKTFYDIYSKSLNPQNIDEKEKGM